MFRARQVPPHQEGPKEEKGCKGSSTAGRANFFLTVMDAASCPSPAELQTLEFHPVEFYDMTLHDSQHDEAVLERSRQNLFHSCTSSCASTSSIQSRIDFNVSLRQARNFQFEVACFLGVQWPRDLEKYKNGATSPSWIGSRWRHTKGQGPTSLGYESSHGHGRQGPQNRASQWPCFAHHLPGKPQSNAHGQWTLHTQGRQPQPEHHGGEPSDGAQDAQHARTSDEGCKANSSHLSGHAAEDRCGGSADPCHRQGAHEPECHVLCGGRTPEGQSFGDEGTSNHGTSANHSKVFGNPTRSDSNRLSSASGQRAQRALDCRGEGSIGLATPGRFQFRSLPIWPRPSRPKCHELHEKVADELYQPQPAELYKPAEHHKSDEPYVTKELYNKIQPLTTNVATKVMMFASTMVAAASVMMMDFTMDGRDGLWEVACAPHSWLSQAAEQHGLHPRRINLQSGVDLHQHPRRGNNLMISDVNADRRGSGGVCLAPIGPHGQP